MPGITTSGTTKGYRDLIAWQKAIDLAPVIYGLVKKLPAEERFGMADQLRRACVSVAANIAEGQGRETPGDFARFLRFSRGSLAELDTILVMAMRIGYFTDSDVRPAHEQIIEIRKILQRLIQSLVPLYMHHDRS
jgi:four helix bundle protein